MMACWPRVKELSLLGLDFNVEVTGFAMGEIDFRIASLEGPFGLIVAGRQGTKVTSSKSRGNPDRSYLSC